MRSTILRAIVIVAAALTAACSSTDWAGPVATPASARHSVSAAASNDATVQRQIDQYVWLSCLNDGASETVRVTGDLRYDVHRTQDSSGVYHFSIKSSTSGLTAVGLTSGAVFRGMMAEHLTSRAEDYLNEDVRAADMIRFMAIGSGESYALMATSRMVVDQGEYIVTEQTWNEVCR